LEVDGGVEGGGRGGAAATVVVEATLVVVDGAVVLTVGTGLTCTVNVDVPISPTESVTEQITVMVPIANVDPDAGVQDTMSPVPSTKSVAVGRV
jgi:hypothetical protein